MLKGIMPLAAIVSGTLVHFTNPTFFERTQGFTCTKWRCLHQDNLETNIFENVYLVHGIAAFTLIRFIEMD